MGTAFATGQAAGVAAAQYAAGRHHDVPAIRAELLRPPGTELAVTSSGNGVRAAP